MGLLDRLRAAICQPCPEHLDDPIPPLPARRKPMRGTDMQIVDFVSEGLGLTRREAVERLQELDLLTLIFEELDE